MDSNEIIPPRKELLMEKDILTDDNFLKIFVTFLKENNAYIPYRNAMAKRHGTFFKHITTIMRGYNKEERKNKTLQIEFAQQIINYSFSWSDTPQNPLFWCKLDTEWKRFVEKCKTKLEQTF